MPHEVSDRPRSKVGTGRLTIAGENYIVTVDYTSNFWEMDFLDVTESRAVLKNIASPAPILMNTKNQYASSNFCVSTQAQHDVQMPS